MNADEFMDEPINDDANPLVAPTASVENHDVFVDDDNKDNESVGQVEDEQQQPQHSEVVPVKDNHEAYFTKSTVRDPVKESDGQNAYISYLVETETDNPVFQSAKFMVRRRFSDFYFLFQVLLNDFPACAIPPLPDKKRLEYLKGDRFGMDFTMKRASSLTRFLARLSLHPILKKAKIYHIFLETHDWNSYRQHLKFKTTAETSTTDGVADALINAFKTASVQTPEFAEIKERSDKLDENITKIDKIFNKILKRYTDLEQDYFDFSIQIKKLAELEPELEVPFLKFSGGLNELSLGFQSLKTFLDNEYIISLKDLEHYITSIKNLLKLKDQKQIDYEELTDYLNKSVSEKNSILSGGGSNYFTNKFEELRGVNHDLARRDRLNKLEHKIENLTKEVDNAKHVCGQFEEQTLHEIQYFEQIKSVELKSTLTDLADNNIKFYKDLIEKWTKIEEALKK